MDEEEEKERGGGGKTIANQSILCVFVIPSEWQIYIAASIEQISSSVYQ